MQSRTINTNLAGASITIPCTGSGFWFESGTSTTSNSYIIVKPDTGAEFRIKPGQSVKDPKVQVSTWTVHAEDPAAIITGNIIIGNGDFNDDNVSNTFKLDATFANTVNVTNTAAQRVPVSLDPAQVLNIPGAIVAYTNSHISAGSSVTNTAIQILAAAANVNGAILNKFELIASSSLAAAVTVLAKATAPGAISDGDVLFGAVLQAGVPARIALNTAECGSVKVPAGKGIWYISNSADGATLRDALITVL